MGFRSVDEARLHAHGRAHLAIVRLALFISAILFAHPHFSSAQSSAARNASSESSGEYAGDQACAHCHREIYAKYRATAMAQASGPIAGNVIAGEFTHAASRVHYKIEEQDGRVWLRLDRGAPEEMHAARELLYFIGSGHRGRTYVFEQDGFYFESPVNWYGQKRIWDMAPAYGTAKHAPLNLPLAASCVWCHVSAPQSPATGTENQYAEPLMRQQGIGCERCHGPGAAHAKGNGAAVNPAKLSAERRDSICMQCHMEGNAAVVQPGKLLTDFRPGEDLRDYIHYFVVESAGTGPRAASQFEALAQSQCKRKSGDALSCTTCHDPHASPVEGEKAAFYSQKCVACHASAKPQDAHFAEGRDCVACHMPRLAASDVAHTAATDHRILKRHDAAAQESAAASQSPVTLRQYPFTPGRISNRDLALAWQTLGEGGMTAAFAQAERFLKIALKEDPTDAALLNALGFLYQREGHTVQAAELERKALQTDATDNVAEVDLGVEAARSGNFQQAEALLEPAFAREPGESVIGMDLAKVLYAEKKTGEAERVLKRVLEFNPDLPEAEEMLRVLQQDPH